MFQGSFNGTLKMLEGWCKDVSRMFQGCFQEFSRKLALHESLESVTRKIEECFEGVSKEFQGYFKEVSKVVQASSRGALRVFQGNFKEAKGCFKGFHDVS